MKSKILGTAKHSGVFALGKVATKLVGFILLPVYTKNIAIADYGALGIFELLELLGIHLFSLALQNALFRFYSLSSQDDQKKAYVFSVFLFVACFSVVSLTLVTFNRHLLSSLLFDSTEYHACFAYLSISILFAVLNKIPLTLLRIDGKSLQFSIIVLVQFSANLLLNIWLIVYMQVGISGVILSQAISGGIVFLILTPYLLRRMSSKLDFNGLQLMIAFSAPLMLAALTETVLNLGDRFLLAKLSDISQVGLYSLGYKFSNVLKAFIVDAFALGLPIVGWQAVKSDDNPREFFSRTLTYIVFVLSWSALALSVFSEGIIHKFALSRDYWDAHRVIPLLSSSIIFVGMHKIFYFILQIPQKTRIVFWIVLSATSINIALNLVLIPLWGMMGAAFATLLSQLCAGWIALRRVKRHYPIPLELLRLMKIAAVWIVLFSIASQMGGLSLLTRVSMKGTLLALFPLLLHFPLRFYHSGERRWIQSQYSKIKRSIAKML